MKCLVNVLVKLGALRVCRNEKKLYKNGGKGKVQAILSV